MLAILEIANCFVSSVPMDSNQSLSLSLTSTLAPAAAAANPLFRLLP